ncbi:MAG: hypothetical protein ABIB11_05040 [Candidatus Omnitrophota bacterium]
MMIDKSENAEKISIYEIHDKRINTKLVMTEDDFKRLNIQISNGQVWINIKQNKKETQNGRSNM